MIGQLELLSMTDNYKVVRSFDSQEYAESLLVFKHINEIQICDIEIDQEWSSLELEYYQSILEIESQSQNDNTNQILMLIPIKIHVPYITQWISFDFEVAILDYR